MRQFIVKQPHLDLLKNTYFRIYDLIPCVDQKRPFGNSDIEEDLKKILALKTVSYKQYEIIFNHLSTCLEILCRNLNIKVGLYEADDYGTDWTYKGEIYNGFQ